MLLVVISAGAVPSFVLSYDENQMELWAGNLLVQNQFYRTSPVQRLFHSQTAAGTDTEAFAFGRGPGGEISLAQTGAATTAATDTGFYFASFSFLKFSNPTGEGFLHTTIGDTLAVGRSPVFAGLMFPSMTKVGGAMAPDTGQRPAVNTTANVTANMTANQTGSGITAPEKPGNVSLGNATGSDSLIKRQMASTDVGVPGRVNVLAVTPSPTPRATPQPAGNATNATGTPRPTPTPTPTPEPTSEPPYAVMPKAATLLTKPMSRQDNKPFTTTLDPDYNPRKATRDQVANISAWDRFTTNVIGRSGIDSTYQNRTSYPAYINPWNSVKLASQPPVMSDSLNMTKSDSYLQPRLWAL